MIQIFCFLAAMMVALPASAHVTANPNQGTAGSYFETQFRVSHGCEGSDTVEVSVKLPPGTIIAKPQAKNGWDVSIKTSKLDKPMPMGHGKMAESQIDEITWRGGRLADGQYDTFGVLMKLPDAPGETLWFPVTQKCVDGSLSWSEIPAGGQAWHDLKSPAPFVEIEKSEPHNHH